MTNKPDYKRFAQKIMKGFPDYAPDGFEIQAIAIACGVLIPEKRTTFCNDGDPDCYCSCYEAGFDEGDEWECYKVHRSVLLSRGGNQC